MTYGFAFTEFALPLPFEFLRPGDRVTLTRDPKIQVVVQSYCNPGFEYRVQLLTNKLEAFFPDEYYENRYKEYWEFRSTTITGRGPQGFDDLINTLHRNQIMKYKDFEITIDFDTNILTATNKDITHCALTVEELKGLINPKKAFIHEGSISSGKWVEVETCNGKIRREGEGWEAILHVFAHNPPMERIVKEMKDAQVALNAANKTLNDLYTQAGNYEI